MQEDDVILSEAKDLNRLGKRFFPRRFSKKIEEAGVRMTEVMVSLLNQRQKTRSKRQVTSGF